MQATKLDLNEIVDMLLEAGVDVDAKDSTGASNIFCYIYIYIYIYIVIFQVFLGLSAKVLEVTLTIDLFIC